MYLEVVESRLKNGFTVNVMEIIAGPDEGKFEIHVKHPTGVVKVISSHFVLGDALENHYHQIVEHYHK